MLEKFTTDIDEKPEFRSVTIIDKNQLSGIVKKRTIHIPNDTMRKVHKRFLSYLRRYSPALPYATGARLGMSPIGDIRRHYGNRFFYLLDIKNAFSSVDKNKIVEILIAVRTELGNDGGEALGSFLGSYFFVPSGGLAVGGPASPDLFNIYTGVLIDKEMGALCRELGITYSRYLDDLTFSSKNLIRKDERKKIREIILKSDLVINHSKAQVLDLKKGPIRIHGINLYQDSSISLPRDFMTSLRGQLFCALKGRDINPDKINGMMGVFKSVVKRKYKPETATEKTIMRLYSAYRQRGLNKK